MAESEPGRIERDLMDEPHVRGRRISVRQVYALVENRGEDPVAIADRFDLDVADERVADLVREHESLIAEEVRAESFGAVDDGHRETWDVEGIEMTITIEPVAEATA